MLRIFNKHKGSLVGFAAFLISMALLIHGVQHLYMKQNKIATSLRQYVKAYNQCMDIVQKKAPKGK